MTRRMIAPLLFGIAGVAVLLALGIWQVQRLAWKQAILTEIAARISGPPIALPEVLDPAGDKYLPVTVSGDFTGEDIAVLASLKNIGAIWRLVAVLETPDGRRIMVDRGYVTPQEDNRTGPESAVTVTGNLHWPEETDSFTPDPDAKTGLWFARDVTVMAAALGTEPVLVVARETSEGQPSATPLPVGAEGIPNDHLNYAITWFSLAAIWAGMTAYLLWRIRARTD